MDAKDEVKRRLSIEEVVGDYLELKRAGRNFKALSPFSNERTPSFIVSPEKQIWHDFSSNRGGDIFSFVMEVEGVDFKEALELLARRANIDLSQYRRGDGAVGKLKKRLLEAHDLATQFYHICLSRKPEALAYVKDKRGFTAETIKAWKLGYSPDDGTSLLQFLTKRSFSTEELSKAGLITKRRGGWGDMFRGRIMIPLADAQGNTVGFTARLLKDNPKAPKYFNTPQTLVYDKGRQVFGFHLAKPAIRHDDFAVLVEGNLDVIASHQAGVTNVVACAGTAMTADHLRQLNRLTPNLRLAFDADEAGLKATERAIGIAQEVGINLLVVRLPEGSKDPDELIQSGPERWREVLASAEDAVTWVLARYEKLHDKTTADGKKQLSTKALAVIAKVQDPVEREHHITNVAAALGVSVPALTTKLEKQPVSPTQRKEVAAQPVAPDSSSYEDDFLALNAQYPDVRDSLAKIDELLLGNDRRRSVYIALQHLKAERLTAEATQRLHLDEDYVKILLLTAEEKYLDFSPSAVMAEAMALARRILKTGQIKLKNELTAQIRRAEERGDSQAADELLKKYQMLIREE